MKRSIIVLLALSIYLILVISCEEEQIIQELQKQIQIEKQIKEKAQQDAVKSRNTLNLLIGFSIAVVLIALIIGVAMGSKSRKDANAQKIVERRENDKLQE